MVTNSEYNKAIQQFDALINSVRTMGIKSYDVEDEKNFFNQSETEYECLWVPAVFTDSKLLPNSDYNINHKIYGGVRLSANLSKSYRARNAARQSNRVNQNILRRINTLKVSQRVQQNKTKNQALYNRQIKDFNRKQSALRNNAMNGNLQRVNITKQMRRYSFQ